MRPAFDLTPSKPLTPANAVAAIIRTDDGRYLLQHRDALPTIFYPDHWGCFGGAMEPGESPLDALRRELYEELELEVKGEPALFGHFRFSVEPAGIAALDRFYYDVPIDAAAVGRFRLGEGAGMELVHAREALHERRLVPYDGFALWLHFYQGKLVR
jgi:8-oxo-dGTP pyrophosphatase MutT (NUDIX family)